MLGDILSTASLVLGVATSHATHSNVLVAGVAGLVAGAMSMDAGEYMLGCSGNGSDRGRRSAVRNSWVSETRRRRSIHDAHAHEDLPARHKAAPDQGRESRDGWEVSDLRTNRFLTALSDFSMGFLRCEDYGGDALPPLFGVDAGA
jgi:hypothetical protein